MSLHQNAKRHKKAAIRKKLLMLFVTAFAIYTCFTALRGKHSTVVSEEMAIALTDKKNERLLSFLHNKDNIDDDNDSVDGGSLPDEPKPHAQKVVVHEKAKKSRASQVSNEKSTKKVEVPEKANKSRASQVSNEKSKSTTISAPEEKKPERCPRKSNAYFTASLGEKYDEATLRNHPNLLVAILNSSNKLTEYYPSFTQTRWSGLVYQESWEHSPKYLLYSARFDSRNETGLDLRIISFFDGDEEAFTKSGISCQLYYNETESPTVVPVYDLRKLDTTHSFVKHMLNPALLTCKVPSGGTEGKFPTAVSLVNEPCSTPVNILKIAGTPHKRITTKRAESDDLKIGICGKALFYYNDDFSVRLMEWIEILRMMGVSKIFLYEMTCHDNVRKVMKYYEKDGIVDLLTFAIPPPYVQEGTLFRLWSRSNIVPFIAIHSVFINDCLLRNKDTYDYLGVIDSDEYFIPKEHKDLQELLKSIIKSVPNELARGSISLRYKLMFRNLLPGSSATNIPKKLHALNHNKRTKLAGPNSFYEQMPKSIHDARQIFLADCHFPANFINASSKGYYLNQTTAYTAHFGRMSCNSSRPEEIVNDTKYEVQYDEICTQETIEEENFLLKYKDDVVKAVQKVAKELQIEL